MSFRFTLSGIEFQCDTAEEAVALARKMAASSLAAKVENTPAKPVAKVNEGVPQAKPLQERLPIKMLKTVKFDATGTLRTFLETLDEHALEGASGEVLSEALKLNHPKALGGRLALINQRIKELHYSPEEVYFMKRDSATGGKRVWYSGKQLGSLLRILK